MKYATFSLVNDAAQRLGLAHGNHLIDLRKLLDGSWSGSFPAGMQEFIEAGPEAWRKMSRLVEESLSRNPSPAAALSPEQVRLHAPVPRPRKNIFCLGLNYAPHIRESVDAKERQMKLPQAPIFFTKSPTSVTGPADPIPWYPGVTSQVDWEAELTVIIGVGGMDIPREKAMEHIFGYTIVNDVSARDVQVRHSQWFKGKSLDGYCPMGPYIVTPDEFGDPHNKRISLRVNGVVKQDGTTSEMLFNIPVMIESLSQGMTLEPGDVIATGTPEGVGMGRTPPEYLKEGDLVETEVEGIGVLRNRVESVRNPR